MRRSLALLSLLLASACLPLGEDDGSSGGDGTGDEGDGGDGGDDGGGDTLSGPCPAYTGYAGVGSRWVYGMDPTVEAEQEYDYVYTYEVTSFAQTAVGADLTVAIVSDVNYDNGDVSHTETYGAYRCDAEGLFLLELRSDWSYSMSGYTGEGWGETVYDYDGPTTPSGLQAGMTWSAGYTATTTSSSGAPSEYTVVYDAAATDGGTVETPAGSFQVLDITYTYEGTEPSSSSLDRDIGWVTSDGGWRLESYTR